MNGRRLHGRWIRSGVSVCLVCAVGACVAAVLMHDYPAHHFGVVEEGVLYRSGQPEGGGWEAIQEKYGIRTVVCLREDEPEEAWYVEEAAYCKRNGIARHCLPIEPPAPTDAQLEQFLDLVADPERQPVLVHCEAGSVRASVMVAAYRMIRQGYSLEEALSEAEAYRFKPHRSRPYMAFLRNLSSDAGRSVVGNRLSSAVPSSAVPSVRGRTADTDG